MTTTTALPVNQAPSRRWLGHPATWVLLTALAPAAWGTTYAVTTELLPPDHPLFAALMRSLPVGLIAVAITRVLPTGDWWWKAGVLGVLNIGVFFPLLFVAAERLPGGVAATLGAAQPVAVAVLAVGILGERPSWWRLGWGVAGVLGVGLVVLGPDAALDATGVVAGLVGALSMALGVVLTKRWGRPSGVGPMALAGWLLTAGGLVLLPLTLIVEGVPAAVDARAVAGYLWLGTVGGLIAYTLWYRGIGHLPVTATALLGLLSPLVAALIGTLSLGESFAPAQLAGFALALAALLAGQLSGAGTRRRAPSAPPLSVVPTDPAPSIRSADEPSPASVAAHYSTTAGPSGLHTGGRSPAMARPARPAAMRAHSRSFTHGSPLDGDA